MRHALAMIGLFILRLVIAWAVGSLTYLAVAVAWVVTAIVAYGDIDRALHEFIRTTASGFVFGGFLASIPAATVASVVSSLLRVASPSEVYRKRMFKEAMVSGTWGGVLGTFAGFAVVSLFEMTEILPVMAVIAGLGVGVVCAVGVRLKAAMPPFRLNWRRRRVWGTALGILGVLSALLVWAAWPGSSTFTISPETTYVTEPLDKYGYVDYVTALNARLRKDIAPANNANVLIWQALGPHPEGGTMPAEYFQWLGIESPPEEGEYFVEWKKYQREKRREDARDPDIDLLSQADRRPWTTTDHPEIAGWLKQNEKPLALVVAATHCPDYYNPLVPERTGDWSPGLRGALISTVQLCRQLAAALRCRAMFLVAEGKVDDAWQDLLACHRLGRLVARGATMIELLVGLALDQSANQADVAFLDHSKMSSNQILAYLEELRHLPPMPSFVDKIDLGERFSLLEIIMLMARYGTPFMESMANQSSAPPARDRNTAKLFTHNIDWDPAFRNANRWTNRLAAALRITDRAEREQEWAAILHDSRMLKRQIANMWIANPFISATRRGELIGNILIGLMIPAYDKVRSAAERCEQGQRNVHVAFALAAYKRDHGRYPETLAVLAPKYLERIPDDLFSGKPLIYRLEDEGYLLYSVGVNGRDDDGRGYGDEPQGDDISVRMPVSEPPGKN